MKKASTEHKLSPLPWHWLAEDGYIYDANNCSVALVLGMGDDPDVIAIARRIEYAVNLTANVPLGILRLMKPLPASPRPEVPS